MIYILNEDALIEVRECLQFKAMIKLKGKSTLGNDCKIVEFF